MKGTGYISDRSCPSNESHGDVLGIKGREGRDIFYCPHADHNFPTLTQNTWTEAEFWSAKDSSSKRKESNENPKKAVSQYQPKAKRRKARKDAGSSSNRPRKQQSAKAKQTSKG